MNSQENIQLYDAFFKLLDQFSFMICASVEAPDLFCPYRQSGKSKDNFNQFETFLEESDGKIEEQRPENWRRKARRFPRPSGRWVKESRWRKRRLIVGKYPAAHLAED